MSADISNVINVQLMAEGSLALADNMNVVAIMTSQLVAGKLDSANRYQIYKDSASVVNDFGSSSAIASYASVFFATQPNPIGTGGYLVAGYWRSATETVAATHAILTGGYVDQSTMMSSIQQVTAGTMSITVDGVVKSLASLNFQTCAVPNDVATIVQTALSTSAIVSFDSINSSFIIKSATTGLVTPATSTITVATPTTGIFVGNILGISAGSGASVVQGADAASLSSETKVAAMTALKALVNIKGAMFIDQPIDADIWAAPASPVVPNLSTWAQANNVLMYDVFSSANNLLTVTANIAWMIKLSGLTNYRMLYSASGNRSMAASYMARVHTVDFNAERSALTMHLKQLSVPAENYTQTQITQAQTVGLDIYTTIKNTPVILTSGANDYVDNRYNLMSFVDVIGTDLYNLLKQTSTKIPQTQRGINQLLDQCERTTRRFVRAEVFAAGTWDSPNFFGDWNTFSQNILDNGFYCLAGKLSDQSPTDRAARKSPVLQLAVKNAGAVHSINTVINFNL